MAEELPTKDEFIITPEDVEKPTEIPSQKEESEEESDSEVDSEEEEASEDDEVELNKTQSSKKQKTDYTKCFDPQFCNKIDVSVTESEHSFNAAGKKRKRGDIDELFVPTPTPLNEEGLQKLIESIIIKKDNPNEGVLVTFYGKRRTGKSFGLRNVMAVLKELFPYGLVMSKTAFNKYWQKHVPEKYVYDHVDRNVLSKFLGRQQRITNYLQDNPEYHSVVNPRVFLILDDVVMDKRIKWMTEIDTIATAGRHFNISCFVTTQAAKGMNPVWRNNTDLAFLMRQVKKADKDSLYEDYGFNLEKDSFMEMLQRTTLNDGILIVNTTDRSGDFKNIYYSFHAEERTDYVLGCKEFWGTSDTGDNNMTSFGHGEVYEKDYRKGLH